MRFVTWIVGAVVLGWGLHIAYMSASGDKAATQVEISAEHDFNALAGKADMAASKPKGSSDESPKEAKGPIQKNRQTNSGWDWFQEARDSSTVRFFTWLAGAVALGWGLHMGYIRVSGQKVASQAEINAEIAAGVAEELSKWNFASALYREIPADADFIVRNLRIDQKVGSKVLVHTPGGDEFIITVSNLKKENDELFIWFGLLGEVDGNTIMSPAFNQSFYDPIPVKRHTCAGPFNAIISEFYVFIEDIQVGYITISVARRPMLDNAKNRIHGNIQHGGPGFWFGRKPPPRPILELSEDKR